MKKLKKMLSKRPSLRHKKNQAAQEGMPRITNDTVAAHRDEVLGSARKYIYPLQHSKQKIVFVTTTLGIITLVVFVSYCLLSLYRFQSNSTFLYRVTQVVPFPIARAGSDFVAYENYLFELRHYIHYYETQVKTDFDDPKNRPQLEEFKQRALNKVVNDAYVKKLAEEHGVKVSDREVEDQIAIVRNQNRLGGSEKVFEDVLKDYWGWTVDDFKRSLKTSLLAQKVVAKLDTDTTERANSAQAELNAGADFAEVVKKYSDDAVTKDNGGEYGFPIDRANRNLSALTTEALFALEPGQVSDIINTGPALEIVKNIEVSGDKVRGAHILFNFKDISEYVNDLKEKEKARIYIEV